MARFFFTWIWAFVKKMWGLGICILIGFGVLTAVETALVGMPVGIASILVAIVIGVKGNAWRHGKLVTMGFERINTVPAKTRDAAIASVARDS
jgi:hypothetical protein